MVIMLNFSPVKQDFTGEFSRFFAFFNKLFFIPLFSLIWKIPYDKMESSSSKGEISMEKKTISIIAALLAVVLVVVGVLFIQAKQTVGSLQQSQSEMAAQIDALNADVADKSSQIDALNADVADKESQIDALNADVADKSSQIDALNADVADKDSQIDALNADVADKVNQIDTLSAELEQALQDSTVPAAVQEEIPDTVPGKHSITRSFLYALDQYDITYTYTGVDDNDKDAVTIDFNIADHTLTFRLWFSPDCEDVQMVVWDVIAFNAGDKSAVRAAVDSLNLTYRFSCFYLEVDNTVTMSMDFIVREDGKASDILLEGLVRGLSILEDAYSTLEIYES